MGSRQPSPGPAKPSTAKPGVVKPEAAKRGAGGTRPKTGVPPWEITDSFLAVPPAPPAASTPAAGQPGSPRDAGSWGGPAAAGQQGASTWGADPAGQPGNLQGPSTAGAGPADSTESFSAVDSGADQRSFPRSNPGDSTESFPAMRPRADIEDAFRLFPPVRGTGNRPPADGQD